MEFSSDNLLHTLQVAGASAGALKAGGGAALAVLPLLAPHR